MKWEGRGPDWWTLQLPAPGTRSLFSLAHFLQHCLSQGRSRSWKALVLCRQAVWDVALSPWGLMLSLCLRSHSGQLKDFSLFLMVPDVLRTSSRGSKPPVTLVMWHFNLCAPSLFSHLFLPPSGCLNPSAHLLNDLSHSVFLITPQGEPSFSYLE